MIFFSTSKQIYNNFTCPDTIKIDLTNCPITNSGLLCLLKKCYKVQRLYLRRLGKEPLTAKEEDVITTLKHLNSLLIASRDFNQKFLEKLSNSAIEKLYIGYDVHSPILFTRETIEILEKFEELNSLALHIVHFQNEAQFSEILSERLTKLDISYSKLSFNFLQSCYSLYFIAMRTQPTFNDRALFNLSNCADSLETVEFENVGITDAGLLFMATEMTHLHTLMLRSCDGVTEAGLAVLTEFHYLENLDISNDHLTDEGLAVLIAELPKIQQITACSKNITKKGIKLLQISLKTQFDITYIEADNRVTVIRKPSASVKRRRD